MFTRSRGPGKKKVSSGEGRRRRDEERREAEGASTEIKIKKISSSFGDRNTIPHKELKLKKWKKILEAEGREFKRTFPSVFIATTRDTSLDVIHKYVG